MGVDQRRNPCLVGILFCFFGVAYSVTGPGDFKILNDFRNGLENPELLKWPDNGGDPCGSPSWPHVFCSNGKVTQIQVQGMGLKGPLPQNLNQLDKLQNVGLQKNNFNGKLPSFSGLSELQFAYLDFNQFDVIPSDFFHGLGSIRVLALDSNPFNESTGWSIPSELQESTQLTNFSCSGCNIVGPLPDFFGKFPSLSSLRLSYNRLSGEISSGFLNSKLQVLWLNDQDGDGMTGSIDVIATMTGLTQAWLHGNSFSGSIPDNIGALTSLRELNLNGNQLVGLIPKSLATMSSLQLLDLNNNMLMGPIPKFKASNVTYSSNLFCQPDPGTQCSPEVNALLDFLGALNYPTILSCKWSGNDPCGELWWGINCNSQAQVSVINLQKLKLNGTLSPSLAVLDSLLEIHLGGNHLNGPIPANLTQLKSLRLLDLSGNNFHPPLPKFHDVVRVIVDGNPLLIANQTKESPSPTISPVLSSPNQFLPSTGPQPPSNNSGNVEAPPSNKQHSSSKGSSSRSPLPIREQSESENHQKFDVVVMVSIVAASTVVVIFLSIYCLKKRKALDGLMVHPKDTSPSDSPGKVVISHNSNGDTQMENGSKIIYNGRLKTQTLEASNLVSIDVLREVTDNFASENLLGRGGFGAVYKGELDDGTKIAVKRMESGVISNKALEEFQAEIAVLSKVQHRHLVSLLGYTIDGNERLLVYEYMPQGALSRHLFHWKSLGLEPLSWMRRLTIALDIARGIEYLHSLAHQSFIHRDLKSSNILLDDSFRAKISDFGLVKLAPDRERSIVTRLAGTFGYLAPEYAVTGKITTKVDVFSFGVVLMELLTGLVALDEQRSEESRYLAEWFWQIKSSRKSLIAAIDPTLDAKEEETFDSICVIAELAGHCTERDPNHRPDMGHVVNVVSPLVEKWKPFEETEEYPDIDHALPLSQMLKGWQEEETKGFTGSSLKDSKGSIPAKPAGFADSFTSADAR